MLIYNYSKVFVAAAFAARVTTNHGCPIQSTTGRYARTSVSKIFVDMKTQFLRHRKKYIYRRKEGPPEMDPLARLERRQQTTTMAVISRIRKMPTANTTIITTVITIQLVANFLSR